MLSSSASERVSLWYVFPHHSDSILYYSFYDTPHFLSIVMGCAVDLIIYPFLPKSRLIQVDGGLFRYRLFSGLV